MSLLTTPSISSLVTQLERIPDPSVAIFYVSPHGPGKGDRDEKVLYKIEWLADSGSLDASRAPTEVSI